MAWYFLKEMNVQMSVPVWWKPWVWDIRYGLDGMSTSRRLPSMSPSWLWLMKSHQRQPGQFISSQKIKTSPLIKLYYIYTRLCLSKGLPKHHHTPEEFLFFIIGLCRDRPGYDCNWYCLSVCCRRGKRDYSKDWPGKVCFVSCRRGLWLLSRQGNNHCLSCLAKNSRQYKTS